MTTCIVPARWGSTRFPGKPLAPIKGATGVEKPLILRTLEVAQKAECFDRIYAATDDDRIAQVCWDDGWDCILTSEDKRNGTERCAEAAGILSLPDDHLVVNLQGDSLLTPPDWLSSLVTFMEDNPGTWVSTTIFQRMYGEMPNPGDVQAIVDEYFRALYFTRAPLNPSPHGWFQHFGIYAYRRRALRLYDALAPGIREEAEMLEQLRYMEHGMPVHCITPLAPAPEREVNYPDDIATVEEALKKWNIE